MNDRIGELLRFDPLSAAEKITGTSYKTDEGTSALGFLMHMDHNERKVAALAAVDDTHFGTTFADALRIFADEGFEIVYDEPFEGSGGSERFIVMAHPDGVLLHVESYGGDRINGGKFHYAIRFRPDVERWGLTSSGRGVADPKFPGDDERYVWVGYHDLREGFRHNLNALRDAGEFVTPWPKVPFLWLKKYSQKDDDYKAVTDRVIASLPAAVQAWLSALPKEEK